MLGMSSKIRLGTATEEEYNDIVACIRDQKNPKAFRNVLDNDQYALLLGAGSLAMCFLSHVNDQNNRHETKLRIRDHFPGYSNTHKMVIIEMLALLSHLPAAQQADQGSATAFLIHLFESRRVKAAFTDLANENPTFAKQLLDNNVFITRHADLATHILLNQLIQENQLHLFDSMNQTLQALIFRADNVKKLVAGASTKLDTFLAAKLLAHPTMRQAKNQKYRWDIIARRLIKERDLKLLDIDPISADDISDVLARPAYKALKETLFYTAAEAGTLLSHEKVLTNDDPNHQQMYQLYIDKYWNDPEFLIQLFSRSQENYPAYTGILNQIFSSEERINAVLGLVDLNDELGKAFLCNFCVREVAQRDLFVKLFLKHRQHLNAEQTAQAVRILRDRYAAPEPENQFHGDLTAIIINSDPALAQAIVATDLVQDVTFGLNMQHIAHVCQHYQANVPLLGQLFDGLRGERLLVDYLLNDMEILKQLPVWNYLQANRKDELANADFLYQLITQDTLTPEEQRPIVEALTEGNEPLREAFTLAILPEAQGVHFIFNTMPALQAFATDPALIECAIKLAQEAQNNAVEEPDQIIESDEHIEKLGNYLDAVGLDKFKAILRHDFSLFFDLCQHRCLVSELGYETLFELMDIHQAENYFSECVRALHQSTLKLPIDLIDHAMEHVDSARFVLLKAYPAFEQHYDKNKLIALIKRMDVNLTPKDIAPNPALWPHVSNNKRSLILKNKITAFTSGRIDKETFSQALKNLNLNLLGVASDKKHPKIAQLILDNRDQFTAEGFLDENQIAYIYENTTPGVKRKAHAPRIHSSGDLSDLLGMKKKKKHGPLPPLPRVQTLPILPARDFRHNRAGEHPDYSQHGVALPPMNEFLATLTIDEIIRVITQRQGNEDDIEFQQFLLHHEPDRASHIVQLSKYFVNHASDEHRIPITLLFLNASHLFQGWHNDRGEPLLTNKQRLMIANQLGIDFIRATEGEGDAFKSTLVNIIYPVAQDEKNGGAIYRDFIDHLTDAIADRYTHVAIDVIKSCAHDINLLRILFAYYSAAGRDFVAMFKPREGHAPRKVVNWMRGDKAKFAQYLDNVLQSDNCVNIVDALGIKLLDLMMHYNKDGQPYLLRDHYPTIVAAAANNPALANALIPDDINDPIGEMGSDCGLHQNILSSDEDVYKQIRQNLGERYFAFFLTQRDKYVSKVAKKNKLEIEAAFLKKHIQPLFSLASTDRELCYSLAQTDNPSLFPIQRLLLDTENEQTDAILELMGDEVLALARCRNAKGFNPKDWSRILNVAIHNNQLAKELQTLPHYLRKIVKPTDQDLVATIQVMIRVLKTVPEQDTVQFKNNINKTLADILKTDDLLSLPTLMIEPFLLDDIRHFGLISEAMITDVAMRILTDIPLRLTEVATLLIAVCKEADHELFRAIVSETIVLTDGSKLTMAILKEDPQVKNRFLQARLDHFLEHMIDAAFLLPARDPAPAMPAMPPMAAAAAIPVFPAADGAAPPPAPPAPSPMRFRPPAADGGGLLGEIQAVFDLKAPPADGEDDPRPRPGAVPDAAALRVQLKHVNRDADRARPAPRGPGFFNRPQVFEIPGFDKFILVNFCDQFIKIPNDDRIKPRRNKHFASEREILKKDLFAELQKLLSNIDNFVEVLLGAVTRCWKINRMSDDNRARLTDLLKAFCQEHLFDGKPLSTKEKKAALSDIHVQVFKKKIASAGTVEAMTLFTKKIGPFDCDELANELINALLGMYKIKPESDTVATLQRDHRGAIAKAIEAFIQHCIQMHTMEAGANQEQITCALQGNIERAMAGRRRDLERDDDEVDNWSDDDDDHSDGPAIPGH